MATVERLFVDTNVLLEATDERRHSHADARSLIESATSLVFSAQVIREYLAVATRPVTANGLGMATSDALDNIREFRRAIRLLPEEKPVLTAFLKLIDTVPCTGKRMHDAHLMATASVHGIRTVVSVNVDDLAPFRGEIEIATPSQVLQRERHVRSQGHRAVRKTLRQKHRK
jgi:predicted nucleic acid-binding protein